MPLECRHIYFTYPGTDQILFEDLNFDLKEPGFHAIFGPSGVGKTSLARIIAGLLPADKGDVRVDGLGKPLYAYNMERLPGWSAVGRHLERITPPESRDKRDALVDAFGLAPLLHRRFAQLSLGQQNRINLVRYLVQGFRMLVMDESLANVDEKMRGRILLTIKEMFPQAFFIYISHNVVEVATYCRDICVLRGPRKPPQVIMIGGQDQRPGAPADHQALQKTMLEIMNAS